MTSPQHKHLFFDTHGGSNMNIEFNEIKQLFQNNSNIIEYSNTFESVNLDIDDGPWRAMLTNPNSAILYLNHYLEILLQS